MSGHVYKRCTCPVRRDEGGGRVNCPRPHGSWTLMANLPQDGDAPRRQHTKGVFATKRDAEAALRDFLSVAATGQVVLPTKITVADYLAGWLDAVEPSLAVTASGNYRIIIRCYVLPHLGKHQLSTLRPDHLITAYRTLLARGGRRGGPLSATTVRTTHRILSKALADAVRDGVLSRNPAANVPLPKAVQPELQVWNRVQVATFLTYAATDRLYAAWLLALLCGLRRGELAGLRWSNVDLERGTVRIVSQRTTYADWHVITKAERVKLLETLGGQVL